MAITAAALLGLAVIVLGVISGMWIHSSSALGGPMIIAILLLLLRSFICTICGTITHMALRHSRRYVKVAGLDRIMQAQVALCILWELAERAPHLQVFPYDYAVIGGCFIFLESLFGGPLLELGLKVVGEKDVDKIGKALLLGAEGAPPFITLKLIEWEVRAGANNCHVGDLVWRVTDMEECRDVDEVSVRRILLNKRPDAFLSMMQDDGRNLSACELLQGTFDMPRCIVQCVDQDWAPKFQQLNALGAGSGDVCVVTNVTASMRNLVLQFVNSAQSAIMLLHAMGDKARADVIKVHVTKKESGISIQELNVPDDIQVLTLHRNNNAIIPHGHTKLADGDEMTICGRPNSLASVTALKKGKVVMVLGRGGKVAG